jgi:hypothetical protein
MARLYAAVDEDRQRLATLLERLNWLEAKWEDTGDPKATAVRELIDVHASGRADRGSALWSLLTLEVFLRKQGW